MPFEKGKSGNPGGRPKEVAEVRKLAQVHGPAAIERLVELMASENERTAVAACEAILNRGFGRPAQSLTVAGDDDSPLFPDKVTVNVVKP
jgi:hypothetical protein